MSTSRRKSADQADDELAIALIRHWCSEERADLKQDNAAYREGVADRQQGRRMQSKAEFMSRHPGADPDDYPLYQAGYNADRSDLHVELAKGGIAPGKYAYLKCPECGLVQDAANSRCTRCGHSLTEARKGMFATYTQKGVKPTLHSKPPPPASKQPDLRKGK